MAILRETAARSQAEEQELDLLFKALSHSVRRGLLERLSRGPGMISELAEPYSMSMPAISKHLGVLEQAGLISITVEGRVHRCRMVPGALRNVDDWLEYYRSFWSGALDRLAEFAKEEEATDDGASE